MNMFYINGDLINLNDSSLLLITNAIKQQNTFIKNHSLYINSQENVYLPKTYYNRLNIHEDTFDTVNNKIGIRHSMNLIIWEAYKHVEKHSYSFDIFSLKKAFQELNKTAVPKILVISNEDWLKLISIKYLSKNVNPYYDLNSIQSTGFLGTIQYEDFSLDIITDTFYKPKVKHSFVLGHNYADISHSPIFINSKYDNEIAVQKGLSIAIHPQRIMSMPFIEK